MILNYSWAVWLAWLLAAFFVVDGLLSIAGIGSMRDALARWRYPRWFHLVNGATCLLTGLLIAWYPTRPLGLLLSLLICVAIWVTLIRQRDFRNLPPSLVLFVVTLVTGWGLRLF